MKKSIFYALTAAAALTTAGSPLMAWASNGNESDMLVRNGNYVMIKGGVIQGCSLEEVLSKLEQEIKDGNWNICPPVAENPGDEITPPDIENPGDETIPPDIENPGDDSTAPGTEKPGNGTTTPDTENQELTFAEQVVVLVNQERVKAGLSEVVLDREIEAAALIRAREIQTSFSHTRPNGSSFSTVLQEQGISYRGAGENIAWGQVSPEKVMEAWMNSEGHRANILNPKYTKIGVGYEVGANGRNYWTQLFTY